MGILEKQDLVDKVIALVTDERRDREIKEREEREEAQRMEWARREREMQAEERRATERERTSPRRESGEVTQDEETKPGSSTNGASAFSPPPYLNKEQEGLCVVCQDEHATMAIIDCGCASPVELPCCLIDLHAFEAILHFVKGAQKL